MTVHLIKEFACPFSFKPKTLIEKVIRESLCEEGFPYEAEISVVLTGNEEIRALNAEMRQIDKATDVLSFPMATFPHPGDFSTIAEQDLENPDTGEIVLGDIMISCEKVKEQAQAYGHSEKREMAFLVAHSMLHLMGYDHPDNDRSEMEEKQEAILTRLSITRDCK